MITITNYEFEIQHFSVMSMERKKATTTMTTYIPYISTYLPISIYLSIYLPIYIYILYIYGIHHRMILWSNYRKLAWEGFEPTTTEFHSDALTEWAIRLWVQIALRANLVQLLQFHRLLSVTFHFGYCLRQSPRFF